MFFTRKRLRLYFFALLYLQLLIGFSCWRFIKAGTVDFRLFYASAHIVRAGQPQQLYSYAAQQTFQNEFVTPRSYALTLMEPPFVAFAFLPLAFLSYLPAFFVFFAINLLLLAIAIALMRPHLSQLSARMAAAPALLFLTFFPAGIALVQGQISLVLLAIYCLAFAELQSGNAVLAGAIFSLALLKFQIALPVVLLFFLWRQWRFLAGFSVGAAVLAGLSVLAIGTRELSAFGHSLFSTPAASAALSAQEKYAVYPRRMPNLYGLCYALSSGHRWGLILAVVCSVLLLLWAARKPASLPLATLVALLVSFHLYIHDLSLLLLPISLLVNQQLSATGAADASATPAISSAQRWSRLAGIGAITLLLLSPFIVFLIASDTVFLLAIPVLVATLALGSDLNRSPGGSTTPIGETSATVPATA